MINRKIVDHISDINLPYTEHSRRYLLSEGLDGKTIFVTGSPMPEVIHENLDEIKSSKILEELRLEKKQYILVSAHREENIDNEQNFTSLMNAINDIAEKYDVPIVFSTHPRTRKFIEDRNFKFHPLVRNMTPFGFHDYNNLQLNALCVLSDSGTLSEESAILNFTAVLIRTSTERPEVLDKGTMIIGGIGQKDIEQAVEMAISIMNANESHIFAEDYTDMNVSNKVIKIILSYTKIVNKTVWSK